MTALADAVNPVSIRYESGLSTALVGVADTREFDAVTLARIKARATNITLQLDNAADAYSWPFTVATQNTLWPLKSLEERNTAVSDQWSLAADSVRAYVLGDLFMRAAQRDPMYIERAKVYYAQGKDMLDAAILSIKNALAKSGGTAGGGATGSGGTTGPFRTLRVILPGGPGNNYRGRRSEMGAPDFPQR